jgi:MFS family permease
MNARLPTRLPAFASRDFRIFLAGQFISLIGTWMQTTVQAYLAYRITGQPIYLGIIGMASTLPTLLFTLPGGVWVERLDKRKVVIVLQAVMMVQAFALAALTLAGVVTIWHIVLLAFVLGAANSIEITARQAMLIELVGRDALPNAIALQSTAFNVARVLGPALAAPLLVIFTSNGEGWAFFVNGVSYLVVILGLFAIHPAPRNAQVGSPGQPGMLSQFREGQRYIRQTVLVLLVILMAAVPGLLAFPVIQQVPAIARDVLQQPGDTDALVAARNSAMVTAQGAGALIAALMLTLFGNIRRKGLLMMAGQFAFSIALIGIALSRQIATTLPMMMLFGWGTVTALATSNTVIQLVVPDELRGRVIVAGHCAVRQFVDWRNRAGGRRAAGCAAGRRVMPCVLPGDGVQVAGVKTVQHRVICEA